MKTTEAKADTTKCITSKTIHLPFRITLKMGRTSRQAGNGRWVPHRPAVFCAAEIGMEHVAGFSIELALIQTDPDWILMECQSLIEKLAAYGLTPPQIITAEELELDTRAFLQLHAPAEIGGAQ